MTIKIFKENERHNKLVYEFITFLKRNDAYEKFFIALSLKINYGGFGKNTIGIRNLKISKARETLIKFPFEIINYSFCWGQTKDGHAYWSVLNNAWRKHVIQQKLI